MSVPNPLSRVYPLILLAIILLTFILASYQQVILNTESDALDQGAYLSAGLAVKEEQHLTDPYRQPLLSWLLAFFAGREMSYFTWAKLLTLTTGLGCVIGCYLVSLRLYNRPGIALLSAFLLASNVFFIQESSTVMVEPLLALIMLLVWFFGLRALELDHWWDWAAGGVVTGLAYLAKESGLFWLPAWGVGTVIANKLKLRAYHKFMLFLLLVLLTVSPLFIHNTIRYGAPVLTDNLSTMWLDDWEEFFAIGPDVPNTLQEYLENHTWRDMADRLLDGMLMIGALSVSVFMPFQLDQRLHGDWYKPYGPLIGAILIAIALACAYRTAVIAFCRKKTPLVAFTVTFLLIYFVGASWYVPVTFDPRYIVPLLPMGYVVLGGMVSYVGRRASTRRFNLARQLGQGATIALSAGILLWAVGVGVACQETKCWTNPFEGDRLANYAESAIMEALNEHAVGSVIVYQPSHDLPIWLVEGRSKAVSVPSNVDWPQFVTYLRDQDAEVVLMTPELYSRRRGVFRYFLYPTWPIGKGEQETPPSLGIRALPANWDLDYASQGLPSPYYVFRITPLPHGESGTHIERGDAQSALGNWDRAEEEYHAALSALEEETACDDACRSSKARVLRTIAQLATLSGRNDEGLRYFDQALDLEPDSGWLRALRGDLLSVMKKQSASANAYQSALEIAGDDWGNLPASLAWIQMHRGNPQEAIGSYREALRISPQNPWYEALLGQALAAFGLPGEAIPLYEDILARKIAWPFVRWWQADAYLAQGETDMATATLMGLGDAPVPYVPAALYQDGLQLNGYRVDETDYDHNGRLKVTLYWTPPPYPGRQYRVYAKLVNAVYDVWGEGQGDLNRQGVPGGAWASEAELQDTVMVQIRPGTPPGAYHLVLDVRDVTQDRWLDTSDQTEVRLGPVELPPRPPRPEQLDITGRRTATFGGRVKLLGYRLDGQARPGNTVSLTLFWQALDEMDTPYTVFNHLTDTDGKLWAQKDNEPTGGFYPTTGWHVGEIVRDQYQLSIPEDAPAGEYTLLAGLYDARTGQRLPATGEIASPVGDSVTLAQITLE